MRIIAANHLTQRVVHATDFSVKRARLCPPHAPCASSFATGAILRCLPSYCRTHSGAKGLIEGGFRSGGHAGGRLAASVRRFSPVLKAASFAFAPPPRRSPGCAPQNRRTQAAPDSSLSLSLKTFPFRLLAHYRVRGLPARRARKEKPRWFSNGSTRASISRTG